jgi:hypothetical protein
MFIQIRTKLRDFFLAPSSPTPLAALRIGIALVLLLQAALLGRDAMALFGEHGIIQPALTDLFTADILMPKLRELTHFLTAQFGWNEATGILACGLVYVASLIAILLGVGTRVAAAIACVLHGVFLISGFYSTYGVDRFTQISLFYFIFMPVSDALSLRPRRLRKPVSSEATLSLRVLQMHLAIAYCASGVEKLVGIQWRDGEAVFRAMSMPTFNQLDVSWMIHYPWLGKALCWGTLVLEIGYPIFIWPRATRRLWILGIESLHVGIAIGMGLYFFSGTMGLLTFCMFAIPSWLEGIDSESWRSGAVGPGWENNGGPARDLPLFTHPREPVRVS